MPVLYFPPPPAPDTEQIISCTKAAVDVYDVGKDRALLMLAILRQEAGKRGVSNPRRNGTKDQGWWQINTHWNQKLKPHNIDDGSLTSDPCLASYTAVWVYRQKLEMAKGDPWQAVGYYRSVNEPYHSEYVIDVYDKYQSMLSNEGFMQYFYSIPPYYANVRVGDK